MNVPLFPKASRLGFGCASLGSRVGARAGLAALAESFEAGVNWFDLAPSYGDGRAEQIFAEFARTRRDDIHICTKFGFAPPRRARVASVIRPMARALIRHLPQLRGSIARGRGAPERLALTGEVIKAGVDASLRRLGVSHVEVLAFHDPSAADLLRDDVKRAAEDLIGSGKVLAIGVAGVAVAAKVALESALPLGCVQVADGLPGSQLADLRRSIGEALDSQFLITHSVFGASPSALLRERTAAQLVHLGYDGCFGEALAAASLDYALARNAGGVVLASMFAADHRHRNIARLTARRPPAGALAEVFEPLGWRVASAVEQDAG